MNKRNLAKQYRNSASPTRARLRLPAVIRRNVAFGMIGTAAFASYFLAPLPIAVGLTILAAVRILIFLREERKEAQTQREQMTTVCSTR